MGYYDNPAIVDVPEWEQAHFTRAQFDDHRRVVRKLLRHKIIRQLAPRRCLDIGCNSGAISEEILAVCRELVGVDRSAPLIAEARRRLPQAEFIVADGRALPFANESFDLVTAFYSLNACPKGEWRAMLDEMLRVVSRQGVGLVNVDAELNALERVVGNFLRILSGRRSVRDTLRRATCYPRRQGDTEYDRVSDLVELLTAVGINWRLVQLRKNLLLGRGELGVYFSKDAL
jgi:SAM-dependent methyltransferase